MFIAIFPAHPPFSEFFPETAAIVAAFDTAPAQVAWDNIPAKAAVYMLVSPADATHDEKTADPETPEEKPLLLATVGDLRSALKRRLLELPTDVKSRRVPYGRLCSRVYWRRVDSPFAANWWYWKTARALFPDTYRALIPWRAGWWIGVERPDGTPPPPFPRLRRTTDLSSAALRYAGPVRDKHATARLIETLEDLFDLCRYYNELVQAPHGKACAYKEMGKCPAPCDGSVPLEWYARQMEIAWGYLTGAPRGTADAPEPESDRATWRRAQESAMKAAAARLQFETAGRIKQRLERAATLVSKGPRDPFAHVASLEAFSFVVLQPGQGKPWIEPWLIHGGRIEPLPPFQRKNLLTAAAEILARYREFSKPVIFPPLDAPAIEQIALVTHHLFRGEDDPGIYLRGAQVQAAGVTALITAAETIFTKRSPPKPLVELSSEPTDSPAAAPATETAPGPASAESDLHPLT